MYSRRQKGCTIYIREALELKLENVFKGSMFVPEDVWVASVTCFLLHPHIFTDQLHLMTVEPKPFHVHLENTAT